MASVALAPTTDLPAGPAPPPQENTVLPALRGDLIITQQLFEGRTYFVIKDPISLQYFRLSAEDYHLATLFDGHRTFGQIRDGYVQRFPHIRLEQTPEEINERVLRFANDLALLQFLRVQGLRLKARYEAARKQKAKKGWFFNGINKLFFSRFSVWDPDEVFDRMAKPIWWIWTKPSLWISSVLIIAALAIFFLNFGRIAPTLEAFFQLENIALVWVTTILIKSIHELGHGLTCKHFKGEVHEVGVMIMVFTPYFFVNVSDSWVMPNRRHRILISAAGIYVELILAALATFLWAVVQPGWLQTFLFNVMVIASFSTVIFNANPLMKFDGYYILTDLMEVPNLQAKSRALIGHQIKNLLFGRRGDDPVLARMPLPRRRFAIFYLYAVLSWVYGYYVIYSLTFFMSERMKEYDLELLGKFLSFSAILAWIIMPIWVFFKGLQLKREDLKPRGRMRRLMFVFGGAAAFLLALSFVPWDLKIRRSGVVQLADPEMVLPEVQGFVAEIHVKEGDIVEAGQPLARLSNRELEQRHVVNEQRLRSAEAVLQRALGLDKPGEQRQAEADRASYEAAFEESKHDISNLTLRARRGGTVLTRDLQRQQGRFLKQNEAFCEVGDLDPMLIKVALTEKQVRHVQTGQRVDLKADAYPALSMQGVVKEIHLIHGSKDLAPGLSAMRGGDVAVKTDQEGKELPAETTFEARISVENARGLLRPGMMSHGNIHAGRHPWGKLFGQSILDLISLDYRF